MATRLSVAAIEKLKPNPDKRREVADAGQPGLYLVLQSSGARSWGVRYRFKGEPRKLTLNGFPSLPIARKLAREALDHVAAGKDPALLKKEAQNTRSAKIEAVFAEFMDKHRTRRDGRPIRESTRLETARLLGLKPDPTGNWIPRSPKSGILAHWAGRDVDSITKRDVLDLLDARVAAGAPVAANRTLAALKTFFTWCIRRDILRMSPAAELLDPSPERKKDRARALEDRELAALWNAAQELGYPYGPVVQLVLLTGQRRDEIREAVRSEIDFEDRVLMLGPDRTKNGHEHRVPLSDLAISILRSPPHIRSDEGWLFTTEGLVPVSNLAKRKKRLDALMLAELRKIDPDAKLQPWRLHDLRHTLKNWMKKQRIPKDLRNAVQNHFDGDMDELYGPYSFDAEKRDVLDRWASHIQDVVSRPPQVIPFQRAS